MFGKLILGLKLIYDLKFKFWNHIIMDIEDNQEEKYQVYAVIAHEFTHYALQLNIL